MANITFVDADDNIVGYGTREYAVANGLVHRIARVFVFNSQNQLLIQKRSKRVKLSGRWDQSAAGHVDEGEDYLTAAIREASEEVGLRGASMTEVGKFYTEEKDEAVVKKRFNTLFTCVFDGELEQDNDEVSEIKWIDLDDLVTWMHDKPSDFTDGFIKTYHFYQTQINR